MEEFTHRFGDQEDTKRKSEVISFKRKWVEKKVVRTTGDDVTKLTWKKKIWRWQTRSVVGKRNLKSVQRQIRVATRRCFVCNKPRHVVKNLKLKKYHHHEWWDMEKGNIQVMTSQGEKIIKEVFLVSDVSSIILKEEVYRILRSSIRVFPLRWRKHKWFTCKGRRSKQGQLVTNWEGS